MPRIYFRIRQTGNDLCDSSIIVTMNILSIRVYAYIYVEHMDTLHNVTC